MKALILMTLAALSFQAFAQLRPKTVNSADTVTVNYVAQEQADCEQKLQELAQDLDKKGKVLLFRQKCYLQRQDGFYVGLIEYLKY